MYLNLPPKKVLTQHDFTVGERVFITNTITEQPSEDLPGGTLAYKGDEVEVIAVKASSVSCWRSIRALIVCHPEYIEKDKLGTIYHPGFSVTLAEVERIKKPVYLHL